MVHIYRILPHILFIRDNYNFFHKYNNIFLVLSKINKGINFKCIIRRTFIPLLCDTFLKKLRLF